MVRAPRAGAPAVPAKTREQVVAQYRVIAHLARQIAIVHEQMAETYGHPQVPMEAGFLDMLGNDTARRMETLGDMLNGMDAVDEEGAALGKVTAVQNYGAGDILEMKGPALRGATLIPFTRAAVPSVDLAMRVIRVDRAAAGLTDQDGDEGPREGPSGKGGFDPGRRPRGPREAGGNR